MTALNGGPPNDRGRPLAGPASNVISDGSSSIIPPTTLTHPKAVCPGFVVFLMRKDRAGWRRQVYVSLHGANKAMDRARANGSEARCMLVELVPVPGAPLYVIGGDHA